jgi:TetR/AcrR family transcriptional repressor of nem operon
MPISPSVMPWWPKPSARQRPPAPLEQTLALYLSPEHLAHPERGCVIAALGGEGARQPTPVRSAFAAAARGLLTSIDRTLHPRKPSPVPSDGALRLVSSMVGAVVLARLVDDPVLARRLLDAAVPPVGSIQAGG